MTAGPRRIFPLALVVLVAVAVVGVVAAALQLRVEIVDWPGLGDIERFALRNALGDVEQDDVAHFLLRREMRQRATDHSRADQRNLLASH